MQAATSKSNARYWRVQALTCGFLVCAMTATSFAQQIEPRLVHVRNKPEREWSDFPEKPPENTRFVLTFDSVPNDGEWCLTLRQQDVKQQWFVSLNDKRLGELVRDENDMTLTLPVPSGILKNKDNVLQIESSESAKAPTDDIRVGQISLFRRPLKDALSGSTVEVTVVEAPSNESIPCRITILDSNGSLASLGTTSKDELAVRPGTVFTATGRASVKLPGGKYTVFAGRGFEYSMAKAEFNVGPGETHQQSLSIRREVPTRDYVACDPHVHTLTHSGHGDATIEERMITLAGEGIELPIATDHNVHVNYEPIAQKLKVRKYFTPVMGNEVTTARGHFNIFPINAMSPVPDHKQTDWGLLFDGIQRTPGVKVAILNHARDLHSGVRPFGPALHNAVVGENLEGWPLRFNAMEVVNSGATQTEVLQLFEDWMGLLNRGLHVTPVGSSDSHDVSRHFVGQARTYVRCDDRDPGNLDVEQAVNSFVQGRVTVSYGLQVEMTVNEKFASGELATVPDPEVDIQARVLGPHWVSATRLLLFSNGTLLRDEAIPRYDDGVLPAGLKFVQPWKIPRPRHDVHLVAIALGPGIDEGYWRTAKPYQPVSVEAKTHVIGCSGAVWLDADGDGRRTAARDYAERLMARHGRDVPKLLAQLADYDEAIAAQISHLLRASGVSLNDDNFQTALQDAAPHVKRGIQRYQDAWRANEIARTKP